MKLIAVVGVIDFGGPELSLDQDVPMIRAVITPKIIGTANGRPLRKPKTGSGNVSA